MSGGDNQNEVSKLQQHLVLLREEYVKLQQRYKTLERNYNVLNSTTKIDQNSFVYRLLRTVAELFNRELYSDIAIKLDGETLRGHRFILAARSVKWDPQQLGDATELDLSDVPYDVGFQLIKWVYADEIAEKQNEDFLLHLMKTAKRFELRELIDQCEAALISAITVRNCLKFYKVAEEIGAQVLHTHCSQLITTHWNDFTSEDFQQLPAPMTYKLFKQKTKYPLHQAVRMKREDVLFLYLIDNDAELAQRVNELDDHGELALELALTTKQDSMAENLVRHQADINHIDAENRTLLHLAIKRGDEHSATFLIKHDCLLNHQTNVARETPLHLLSGLNPTELQSGIMAGMCRVAELMLGHNADTKKQDARGNNCLHRAILANNMHVFRELLKAPKLALDDRNKDDHVPLWLALQQAEQLHISFDQETFASLLVGRGASVDAIDPNSNESILHKCARHHYQQAGLYLIKKGTIINHVNKQGETALHLTSQFCLEQFTRALLENSANPNIQTYPAASFSDATNSIVGLQTPIHRAVYASQERILEIYIQFRDRITDELLKPNFNIQDEHGQSIFSLTLWMNMLPIAKQLLQIRHAKLEIKDCEQTPLLAQAISKQNVQASLFLLEQGADVNEKTHGLSPIQLAVKHHLPSVVEALCRNGANMNVVDENDNSVLWNALDSGQEDIASILVKFGCDSTQWSNGPDNCRQTLLHRAIDENNESVACFLIRSGCDINSSRQSGVNGEAPDICKTLESPLHLAAQWGLERVVSALIEYHADINKKDAEANTPLHVAIINQHTAIINLLLNAPSLDLTIRNKQNQTPFACSMVAKNNEAANLILKREPRAAEQLDNKGRNFLHVAVQNGDIESVLFLLTVHVNVNNCVQDASKFTPLHLSVQIGSEIILRNLILAGGKINDVTANSRSALHIAAENNRAAICNILLENHIQANLVDANQNTALHLAVQHAHADVVRCLLAESDIDELATNAKGMNCLHVLAANSRENAQFIFEQILKRYPTFPLDIQDAQGNTALLLAYKNGHGQLCRALVTAGANLSICNNDSLSIFTSPAPSKALLVNILDIITREPPWGEGETCLECGTKFTITNRRHHCRHCGRVLCKRCSVNELPIMKFNLQKPINMARHRFSKEEILIGRRSLLAWYDTYKRKLPWRDWHDTDSNVVAYRVLVSELMLQQTQVATVIRYYETWMKQWPDIKALAEATEDDVLKCWAGLGYYNRARNLHKCAHLIINEFDGEFPKDLDILINRLPGVGRYTAGAVSSIAFSQPNPILDGNVIRVLSRMRCIGSELKKKSTSDFLWSLATDIVCPERPGDLNQSLMELGATVCTPQRPKCDICPVQNQCLAYLQQTRQMIVDIEECASNCSLCLRSEDMESNRSLVENYPRKKAKTKQRDETSFVLILYRLTHQLEFLMIKQKKSGLLSGLWSFTEINTSNDLDHMNEQTRKNFVIEEIQRMTVFDKTINVENIKLAGQCRHLFSHIDKQYIIYYAYCEHNDLLITTKQMQWFNEEQLQASAISTAMKKVFNTALPQIKLKTTNGKNGTLDKYFKKKKS
ncbi:unnamed protein product [Rotaria socialis]|uniref:Adenine DNA glycosylase n=2 Tax=Rotaria socialis TaxID=392032 RepID=A0A818U135_9BILA|nr:unnamed protein product [Rotaria socialis]CAF4206022.1 unnamed protein product [Rotaria socialis]CAF4353703.1 unnamed protein product [Rotaria socialis]CAF4580870.1 unnamed protein product [Rotaria socialis]